MRAVSDIDIGRQGTAARLMAILDASQQQGISAEELTLNKSTWAGTARETLQSDAKGPHQLHRNPGNLSCGVSSGACQRRLCSMCAFRAALKSLQEYVPVRTCSYHPPLHPLFHVSKQPLKVALA